VLLSLFPIYIIILSKQQFITGTDHEHWYEIHMFVLCSCTCKCVLYECMFMVSIHKTPSHCTLLSSENPIINFTAVTFKLQYVRNFKLLVQWVYNWLLRHCAMQAGRSYRRYRRAPSELIDPKSLTFQRCLLPPSQGSPPLWWRQKHW
jgi:hypothetical protein